MSNLPQDFQITINSRGEFDQAWQELQSAGYKLTRHEGEKHYKMGGVIKHCSGHKYIWSSTMRDTSKTQFRSFAEFQTRYADIFKPSMNDVIALVELDQEVGQLQAVLDNAKAEVMRQEAVIAGKMEALRKLQQKLNISA